MQLFKQIILKNYQKYIENKLNNRFFPYEVAQSISLVLVILHAEEGLEYPKEAIYKVNDLYKKYLTMPNQKSMHIKENDLRKKEYMRIKRILAIELEKELNELIKYVFMFLKSYKVTKVVDSEKKQFAGDGIFAVIYPAYSYEVELK